MEIRDAVQDDVPRIATIADRPIRAIDGMLRARTVRIAVEDGEVHGVVSFDVAESAVEITLLAGDTRTFAVLLEEPRRFARRIDGPVEMVVPSNEESVAGALSEMGFENVGQGPRFAGEPTTRYRLAVDVK